MAGVHCTEILESHPSLCCQPGLIAALCLWWLSGMVPRHVWGQSLADGVHEDGFPAATHNSQFSEARCAEAYFLLAPQSRSGSPGWELSCLRRPDPPSPALGCPSVQQLGEEGEPGRLHVSVLWTQKRPTSLLSHPLAHDSAAWRPPPPLRGSLGNAEGRAPRREGAMTSRAIHQSLPQK